MAATEAGGQAECAMPEGQFHLRKIYVGGLAGKTTSKQLREYFAQSGPVANAVVVRSLGGRSRGFGYVTFTDAASSATALGTHQIGGREVAAERAVLNKKKPFVQGLYHGVAAAEPCKQMEAPEPFAQETIPWRSWPHSALVCRWYREKAAALAESPGSERPKLTESPVGDTANSAAADKDCSSLLGSQDSLGRAPTRSPSPSSQPLESPRSSSSASTSTRPSSTAMPRLQTQVPQRGPSPVEGDGHQQPHQAQPGQQPVQDPGQVPFGWSPAFYARALQAQARQEALMADFLRQNPGFTVPTWHPSPPREADAALMQELRPKRSQPLKERKRIWRELCLRLHPDKSEDKAAATAAFQRLQALKRWFLHADD